MPLNTRLPSNPRDAAALVNYGVVLQQLGDLTDAKEQEEKAISINPTDVNAYCNPGVVLFQLGFTGAAAENLIRVLS